VSAPRGRIGFGRALKPFRRPRLWSALWSAAVAALVVVSLVPLRGMPQVPEGTDKVEHFLAYALLSAGAVQLYAKRLSLLSACVALALLGIALEYAQQRMGLGRAMDVRDAFANTLGVLAGLATLFTPWRDALLRFDTRGYSDAAL
jgi:VanZ family protein